MSGLHRTSCDTAGAAVVSGMFAADLLSWTEDDPRSRGLTLAEYVLQPRRDAMEVLAFIGWSGRGRQRVDAIVIGRALVDELCGRVIVKVHAQVTRYYRTRRSADGELSGHSADAYLERDDGGASAVVSEDLEWENERSWWTEVDVPVRRVDSVFMINVNEVVARFGGIDLAGEPPCV